jgi:anaerobic ribonucleoside-triphosphate reductase activating protein
MLKYVETEVTFSEIPEEISLCINISNCPIRCPDCHSKHLWEDIGTPLDNEAINTLITSNKGITCVVLMGGDSSPAEVSKLSKYIKQTFNLKVGWYSGRSYLTAGIDIKNFDYIKLGPYDESKGPLTSKTTNQMLCKITVLDTEHVKNAVQIEDITSKFWK